MSLASFAQVTFENNDGDNVMTDTNGVGCGTDNNWGRNFVLSEFTVPASLGLLSGQIGIQSGNGGDVTVNVYSSSEAFVEADLVLLGTQTVTVDAVAAPTLFDFVFDEPVVVGDDVVALFMEVVDPLDAIFPGGSAGNTDGKESWLKSVACGVADYTTATAIGFPDAHYLLTLTGDTVLGVNDIALSQVSVYPNPATDVVNVKVPSSIELNTVSLYDVLGKKVNVEVANAQINVSNLSRGVYIINVETSAGTMTDKLIIE